jgi:hypothetical protein
MNRNLSPKIAKGMYGAAREIKGADYLRGNIGKNSGGVLRQASSVNGNLDTVRKIIPSGRMKP